MNLKLSWGQAQLAPSLVGALGLGIACAVWEILGRQGMLGSSFPPLSESVSALARLLHEPGFRLSVRETLLQWLVGLLITAVVAVPLGLIIGLSRPMYQYTASTIDFLRAVPPIVLLPIFVMAFGTGWKTVLLSVLSGATWPILISTMAGARSIEVTMLDTARVYKFNSLRRFVAITLPASGPLICTGLRIASGLTLIVVVVVQLVGSVVGIGRFISEAQLAGQYSEMYAGVLTIGIIGVFTNAFLAAIERRALARHGHRAG